MGKSSDLLKGRISYTLLELLNKAALHCGLTIPEGASKAYSEPIETYALDRELLAFLAKRGIKEQARPDCNYDTYTLVDENPQKPAPGYVPSNYWNFKRRDGKDSEFDLQITLSASFCEDVGRRGIALYPHASGTFVSPCDTLPNFRMFKALVEYGIEKDTNSRFQIEASLGTARRLVESDGSIVVSWTDLELGGIRTIGKLFREFSRGKEEFEELARSGNVFNPVPYPRHRNPGEELYIIEPAQPALFDTWRDQLKEYRSKLAL